MILLCLLFVCVSVCESFKLRSAKNNVRVIFNSAINGDDDSSVAHSVSRIAKEWAQNSPIIQPLSTQYQYQQKIKEYSTQNKSVFNDMLDFPCEFSITVIGCNDFTFASDVLSTFASVLSISPECINRSKSRTTAGGKYMSMTLRSSFQCAQDLYSVYSALSADKRVKYIL